ncbi:MAG: hypothetical protein ABIQ74_12325 [Chitinophagales bacterium]
MNLFKTFLVFLIISVSSFQITYGQGCCAGGGGSPIAGGASQGVLQKDQLDINLNFQHTYSNKFLGVDPAIPRLLQSYNTNYLFPRISYGVTKDLTVSIAGGYYFNKTQYGADFIDTIKSGGIGDLIIFPRYNVWHKQTEKSVWEATIGLGFKIPLGKYNDSLVLFQNQSVTLYQQKPPGVQPTTGSNDFIFYGFILHGFPQHSFKVFSSVQYILKGWNPKGEKFGNYADVSLYFAMPIAKNFNATLSGKYEYIGKLKRSPGLPVANYDVTSFGSNKIFIVPQLSYTAFHKFTFYGLYEFPVYQKVNGGQVASDINFTLGMSYRIFVHQQ